MNSHARHLLSRLRDFSEVAETAHEGHRWRETAPDPALVPGMTGRHLAGLLTELERLGLYRPGPSPERGYIRIEEDTRA